MKAREGGTACNKRDDACGMMSVETSAGAEVLKCDQIAPVQAESLVCDARYRETI